MKRCGLLRPIRITNLLLEVDAHSGFSIALMHQCTDRKADDKLLLLTAILADGINHGQKRMAVVSSGLTTRQIRERAMLLIGFAGGLRGSEIVGLILAASKPGTHAAESRSSIQPC